jgi:hypothetical protein
MCRDCSNLVCKSGFVGLRIICDNLDDSRYFNSCDEFLDTGYLEIFYTYDDALVSGCPLLAEHIDGPAGF